MELSGTRKTPPNKKQAKIIQYSAVQYRIQCNVIQEYGKE